MADNRDFDRYGYISSTVRLRWDFVYRFSLLFSTSILFFYLLTISVFYGNPLKRILVLTELMIVATVLTV